jgi:hypothetical protein
MLFSFVGRILFPRRQPWEQRRKTKMLFGTLFVAFAFAASVGAVIYHQNSIHR